jgi:hypothetical protein
MAVKGGDLYVNRAFGSVTETAANTLTFEQIHFGTSIREKMALVIHRIRYRFARGEMNKILDDSDGINMAITRSENITTIGAGEPAVIDNAVINLLDFGTPANAYAYSADFMTRDFSTLPGGGLIAPAKPIFIAVQGVSLASAVTLNCTMYFTFKMLKPQEYWELVETMRVIQ